jgi:hypothetical protein
MRNADNIPPAVRILLEDRVADRSELVKVLPELRRQAVWTIESFPYEGRDPAALGKDFVVSASGALNPVEGRGCWHPECRLRAAHEFARSVCLYADVVTIPDTISFRLAYWDRMTHAHRHEFFRDVQVLKALKPLIERGILRFTTSFECFSESHYRQLAKQVDDAVQTLLPILEPELKFMWRAKNCRENCIKLDYGNLFEPHLVAHIPVSDTARRQLEAGAKVETIGRELFARNLSATLQRVLFDLKSASNLDSTLFSASRLHMLALNALEGISHDLHGIDVWEQERSVELPWVKRLAPGDVVTVREEAVAALPRFREMMRKALVRGSTVKLKDVIDDLRMQMLEVEAELKALNPRRTERFWQVAGGLGINISIYAFAAGYELTSLGSLLTLLTGMGVSLRKNEQEAVRARSRAGYVLLKARELVQHRR